MFRDEARNIEEGIKLTIPARVDSLIGSDTVVGWPPKVCACACVFRVRGLLPCTCTSRAQALARCTQGLHTTAVGSAHRELTIVDGVQYISDRPTLGFWSALGLLYRSPGGNSIFRSKSSNSRARLYIIGFEFPLGI